MIPSEFLQGISAELDQFRGNGQKNILFDSRDKGNFSGYSWEKTCEMLGRADPTGLCIGMLLNEMIEATIRGSKVSLEKVLREPGFLEMTRSILGIQERLLTKVGAPMEQLISRVNQALSSTSKEAGVASSREVAICLRDAIHAIESGLTLRWLDCDEVGMKENTRLSNAIPHFKDAAEFADALRHDLSWGAHLARIGQNNTAIGIKQPGKIAFLSTLYINTHGQGMRDAGQTHNVEHLDLETAATHYPKWVTTTPHHNIGHGVTTGRDTHLLNELNTLPRDNLIWFAMVVEIATQRMAATDPKQVELSENIARALPASESNIQASGQNLPMVIQPNWTAADLSIEQGLKDLEFTDWEKAFFAPALEGLSSTTFLPYSSALRNLNLITREVSESRPDMEHGFASSFDRKTKIAHIQGMHPDWVGTRKETEAARKKMFEANLAGYLLKWGNLKFETEWEASKGWFKDALIANLEHAMYAECVQLKTADYSVSGTGSGVHLYSQSEKHKTYNPRCFFNKKKTISHVAHFKPKTDLDLVEILGLNSVKQLPAFLQGWSRSQSWATSTDFGSRACHQPVDTNHRWDFSQDRDHQLEASLCLNSESLPDKLFEHLAAKLPGWIASSLITSPAARIDRPGTR